jgi:hypothetical protein
MKFMNSKLSALSAITFLVNRATAVWQGNGAVSVHNIETGESIGCLNQLGSWSTIDNDWMACTQFEAIATEDSRFSSLF